MARKTTRSEDVSLADEIVEKIRLTQIKLDAGEILEIIQENFEPDDIFDDDQLAQWATGNGYVKED